MEVFSLIVILSVGYLPHAVEAITCATVRCAAGYQCKEFKDDNIQCITTPCDQTNAICVPEKPGSCPKEEGFGICIASCSIDETCPGDQKCCGGCPRDCKDPVKEGTCPQLSDPEAASCTRNHRCDKDGDCRGRRKCCGTCPRRCRSPAK